MEHSRLQRAILPKPVRALRVGFPGGDSSVLLECDLADKAGVQLGEEDAKDLHHALSADLHEGREHPEKERYLQ